VARDFGTRPGERRVILVTDSHEECGGRPAASGAFFDVRDGRALRAAIDRSLAFPFEVLEATGRRVAGGMTGTAVRVPEGVYTVVLRPAGPPVTVRDVRVRCGVVTRVVLTKDGGEIGFRVVGPSP